MSNTTYGRPTSVNSIITVQDLKNIKLESSERTYYARFLPFEEIGRAFKAVRPVNRNSSAEISVDFESSIDRIAVFQSQAQAYSYTFIPPISTFKEWNKKTFMARVNYGSKELGNAINARLSKIRPLSPMGLLRYTVAQIDNAKHSLQQLFFALNYQNTRGVRLVLKSVALKYMGAVAAVLIGIVGISFLSGISKDHAQHVQLFPASSAYSVQKRDTENPSSNTVQHTDDSSLTTSSTTKNNAYGTPTYGNNPAADQPVMAGATSTNNIGYGAGSAPAPNVAAIIPTPLPNDTLATPTTAGVTELPPTPTSTTTPIVSVVPVASTDPSITPTATIDPNLVITPPITSPVTP